MVVAEADTNNAPLVWVDQVSLAAQLQQDTHKAATLLTFTKDMQLPELVALQDTLVDTEGQMDVLELFVLQNFIKIG